MISDTLLSGDNVLIYGGTFDPPHKAHIELAYLASKSFCSNEIIFVPTGNSPHKKDTTAAIHRVRMLELAVADVLKSSDKYSIDKRETEEEGISYTVDFLKKIKEETNKNLILLIGSDQAKVFNTWKSPNEILSISKVVVVSRQKDDQSRNPAFSYLDVSDYDISSTRLRELLRSEAYESSLVKEWLSPEVLSYIKENKLYIDNKIE